MVTEELGKSVPSLDQVGIAMDRLHLSSHINVRFQPLPLQTDIHHHFSFISYFSVFLISMILFNEQLGWPHLPPQTSSLPLAQPHREQLDLPPRLVDFHILSTHLRYWHPLVMAGVLGQRISEREHRHHLVLAETACSCGVHEDRDLERDRHSAQRRPRRFDEISSLQTDDQPEQPRSAKLVEIATSSLCVVLCFVSFKICIPQIDQFVDEWDEN